MTHESLLTSKLKPTPNVQGSSVLNFLSKPLLSVNDAKVYADLPGYKSPSIITGDEYRPDLLLLTSQNTLYVAELTVGHESNLENNSNHKKQN